MGVYAGQHNATKVAERAGFQFRSTRTITWTRSHRRCPVALAAAAPTELCRHPNPRRFSSNLRQPARGTRQLHRAGQQTAHERRATRLAIAAPPEDP
jgi:hypothetical protein